MFLRPGMLAEENVEDYVEVPEMIGGRDGDFLLEVRGESMKDAGIVRNRMKIESTINNARATLRLANSGESLTELFWSSAPKKRKSPPRSLGQVPALTAESAALSKTLLKKGFAFVGPTTLYAAMQSLGIVDDHVASCHRAR